MLLLRWLPVADEVLRRRLLDHHALMQWKDPASTGLGLLPEATTLARDPDLRQLKRIMLEAWFPDRVHELDVPEPDDLEPVGDGEDYNLDEEDDLEVEGGAEGDEHPVEEMEEAGGLPHEADAAAEPMAVDGEGDGPTEEHDVVVLSDEENNTPPHKPVRMLSRSGSKLDAPVAHRLQMLKMQLEAVK
ncbi:unnamed protein product [Symbiodinium necroappetens]|nr:unnamed protein product [Symbiodinium necroappetens]